MNARQVIRDHLADELGYESGGFAPPAPPTALTPLRRRTSWAGLAAVALVLLLACVGAGAIARWSDDQAFAQLQAIDAELRAVEERAVLRTRTQMSAAVLAAYKQGVADGQRERGCTRLLVGGQQ
jgi:hypothetical protein